MCAACGANSHHPPQEKPIAIYHLNAKAIGRSQGRSATGAAAYRAAVRIEDTRTGLIFDYSRKRGVDGAEILAPDGAVLDRATLWNLAEHTEKRSDAQVCREVEVALPRELTPEQMRSLVRGFVREQFVALGMVADIAFHHLTGTNPHAHILLTLRDWREGAFGLKRRDWNDRALCERWRQGWADHANTALAEAGHAARIDPRTLVEQAAEALRDGRHDQAIVLDRQPTIHERGNPAAITHNTQVRAGNAERLAAWAAIEVAAACEGRLIPEATDAAPDCEVAKPVAADPAFIEAMAERRDTAASRWRYYDQRVREAAAWLSAYADEEARRSAQRERMATALAIARKKRGDWLDAHPRPPWWRFWERPAWQRARTRQQAQVGAAKRKAARAEREASPTAITAWRATYAAQQAEHAEALRERQRLALLPSEEAFAEQMRHACRARARATALATPRPQVRPPIKAPPPSRPRPGRRR